MTWNQRPGTQPHGVAVWNPWREMQRFQDELERSWLGRERPRSAQLFPIEVLAKDDVLRVRAELPGCTASSIGVSVEGDVLKLTFESAAPARDASAKTLQKERDFGQFTRSLRLPFSVDADAARATYERGILTIDLPRAAEDKPRKIEVVTKDQRDGGAA